MKAFATDSHNLLESMSESVVITNTQLDEPGPIILYVNPAFERMTGWTREEVLGKSPRLLQGPKTDQSIFHNLKETLAKGEPWTGRTINYRKDGSEFYMAWSITPLLNKEGEIGQYIAVQKEVTEIVRTEQKLQRAMEVAQNRLKELKKVNRKLNEVVAQQNKTLELFIKYVPEPIIKKSLSDSQPGVRTGEELEVALLFCDIRGFSAIVERLSPDQVVKLLNTFYSGMSEVINQYNGVINEFIGDEIFVSFGAPLSIEQPELSSVKSAIAMIDGLKDVNATLQEELDVQIEVGIGINFGPVIAGNLGSENKLAYAITGSHVITAKRIESLTREVPNSILISQSVYDKVHPHVQTKPLGKVRIKGKDERINVYQVIADS